MIILGKVRMYVHANFDLIVDSIKRGRFSNNQGVKVHLGKNVRPALRLWGESPEGHLLTRHFGSSVAIWLRN